MSASATSCIEATVAVLGSLQLDTVPVAWLDQVRLGECGLRVVGKFRTRFSICLDDRGEEDCLGLDRNFSCVHQLVFLQGQ